MYGNLFSVEFVFDRSISKISIVQKFSIFLKKQGKIYMQRQRQRKECNFQPNGQVDSKMKWRNYKVFLRKFPLNYGFCT